MRLKLAFLVFLLAAGFALAAPFRNLKAKTLKPKDFSTHYRPLIAVGRQEVGYLPGDLD